MDRQGLLSAWANYYLARPGIDIGERCEALGRRMRALARFPEARYHGFLKRELEIALGMAYGVHKQLLWASQRLPGGLTSFARGVKVDGWRVGKDLQLRLATG